MLVMVVLLGRYDAIKEAAFEYAWMLAMGVGEVSQPCCDLFSAAAQIAASSI